MELKFRLLDHPFYQSWNEGTVSREQLANYAASYTDFIELIPVYWDKIIKDFGIDSLTGERIVVEEKLHIPLWKQWRDELEEVESYPKMTDLINGLEMMNTSELLGAIHAFEIQQPEVAYAKKKGLLNHYGFEEKRLMYFDEHMKEEEHIKFGEKIAEEHANIDDFKAGFNKGSEFIYKSLDLFMEC